MGQRGQGANISSRLRGFLYITVKLKPKNRLLNSEAETLTRFNAALLLFASLMVAPNLLNEPLDSYRSSFAEAIRARENLDPGDKMGAAHVTSIFNAFWRVWSLKVSPHDGFYRPLAETSGLHTDT